jgi:hypothetical protein
MNLMDEWRRDGTKRPSRRRHLSPLRSRWRMTVTPLQPIAADPLFKGPTDYLSSVLPLFI